MLIKFIDGALFSIDDANWHANGCNTCDYGSSYVTELEFVTLRYKVSVEFDKMYEYALSQSYLMQLFLNNYNLLTNMSEVEFVEWLKTEFEKFKSLKKFIIRNEEK